MRTPKGNIVVSSNPDDIVWGVLFEIEENDKPSLDEAEGLGRGYNEQQITTISETSTLISAQVYIADPTAIDDSLRPYDWYKEYVVSGANQNHLPSDYIVLITAWPAVQDPDEGRSNRHWRVLGIS